MAIIANLTLSSKRVPGDLRLVGVIKTNSEVEVSELWGVGNLSPTPASTFEATEADTL